jgi:hypothetical protein
MNYAVMTYFKALSQDAPGGSEEAKKASVTVSGVRVEIRNLHLQNTSCRRCHLRQFAGSHIFLVGPDEGSYK